LPRLRQPQLQLIILAFVLHGPGLKRDAWSHNALNWDRDFQIAFRPQITKGPKREAGAKLCRCGLRLAQGWRLPDAGRKRCRAIGVWRIDTVIRARQQKEGPDALAGRGRSLRLPAVWGTISATALDVRRTRI
jgi:hypothetical protein